MNAAGAALAASEDMETQTSLSTTAQHNKVSLLIGILKQHI
jgi:hypothetical protein